LNIYEIMGVTAASLWNNKLCNEQCYVTMRNIRNRAREYKLYLPGERRTIPSITNRYSILFLRPAITIQCAFPIPENEEINNREEGDGGEIRPISYCEIDHAKLMECKLRLNEKIRLKKRKRKLI